MNIQKQGSYQMGIQQRSSIVRSTEEKSMHDLQHAKREEHFLQSSRRAMKRAAIKNKLQGVLQFDPIIVVAWLGVLFVALVLTWLPGVESSDCIGDAEDGTSTSVKERRANYRRFSSEPEYTLNPLVSNMVEICQCVPKQAEFVYLDCFTTSVLAALTPLGFKVGLVAKKYAKYLLKKRVAEAGIVMESSVTNAELKRRELRVQEHKLFERMANEALSILVLYASLGLAFWSLWAYLAVLQPKGDSVCLASSYVSAIMYRPFALSSFFALGLVGDHVYWYIRDLMPESTRIHLTIDHPPAPLLSPNVFTLFGLSIVATLLILWWGSAVIFVPLGIPFLPILTGWVLVPVVLMYFPMKVADWIEHKFDGHLNGPEDQRHDNMALVKAVKVPEQFKVKAMIATMLCLVSSLSSLSQYYVDGLWLPLWEGTVSFIHEFNFGTRVSKLGLDMGMPLSTLIQYGAAIALLVVYELFKFWMKIYTEHLRYFGSDMITTALVKRKQLYQRKNQQIATDNEEQQKSNEAKEESKSIMRKFSIGGNLAFTAVKANFRKMKSTITREDSQKPSEAVKKDDLLALYGSTALLLYKKDKIDGSRMSDDARARLAADIGTWHTLDPEEYKDAKINFINGVLETLEANLSNEEREMLRDDVGHWNEMKQSSFDDAKNSWQDDFISRSMVMTWGQLLLITPHKVVVHFGLALASFINSRLFAREFEQLETNSKKAYQSAMKSVSSLSNVEEDVPAAGIKEWTEKQMKRRTAARKFLAASIQVYQSTGGGGMGGKPMEIEELDLSDIEQRRIVAELALLSESFDNENTGKLLNAIGMRSSPKLRSICLQGAADLVDAQFIKGTSRFPSLGTIDCSGCYKLTDAVFEFIGRYSEKGIKMPDETEKVGDGVDQTSPKGISDGKEKTRNLLRLGVKAVATVAPKLSDVLKNATLQLITSLNFSNCELITSEGLKKLASVGLNHLAFIDFSFCTKLTDEGVDALIFSCGKIGNSKEGKGLKSLRFRGCESLTKAALKSLSNLYLDFRLLIEVDFALNPELGDDALQCFRIDGFPALQAIDFSRTFGQSKAVEEDENGDPVLYDEEGGTEKVRRLKYPLGVTNKGLAHVKQMHEKASKKLSVLKFEHCATIDDEGFKKLLNFQFLTVLSIGGTGIGNKSIENICKSFNKLISLSIEYCGITDEGLAHFLEAEFKETLRFLNFRECDGITDDGLVHLQKLTALESLSFHGCDKFKKFGMVHVTKGHLKNLRRLDVGSSGKKMEELDDEGLVELHKSKFLIDLNLSSTKISDRAINILRRGSKEITDTGSLRNLLSLNLSWTRISDEGLLHLEDACNKDDAHLNLKHISLKGCRLVTDIGLGHVLAATANTIEELNIAFVPHVTNTTMKKIRDRELPKLRYLNVSFTKVSDRGVLMVSERGLPQLEDLVMAGCSKLTAECAADFGRTKSLRRVRSLNFFGCKYINDETVATLKNAQLPYLVSINMGFTGISQSTRTILESKKSYQLKSLDIRKCNLEGHGKKFNFIHALKKVMADEEKEEQERERKVNCRLTDTTGQTYRVDLRVEHGKRGKGTVTDIDEENERIFVKYDTGHEHRYDQLSLGSGKIRVLEGSNSIAPQAGDEPHLAIDMPAN